MKVGERVLLPDHPHQYFLIREVRGAIIRVVPNDSKMSIEINRARAMQLHFAHFGNGYTFWLPDSSIDVAHISKNREISYRKAIDQSSFTESQKKMMRSYIELIAREDEGTVSATQSTKVLDDLTTHDKAVNRIIKMSYNAEVDKTPIIKAAMIHEAISHFGLKDLDLDKLNKTSRSFMDKF